MRIQFGARLALLAAFLALPVTPLASPPLAFSQTISPTAGVPLTSVSQGNATEDNDTAFLVQYIGSSASGLVAIDAATGDLTFTQGALAGEVATTSFECPVSAPLGGVIDVSDAACNTMDEVCDIINASSDWRCVLVDSLGADTSVDALVTISATQAKVDGGLSLKIDTSTVFLTSRALLPPEARRIEFYYADTAGQTLRRAPFAGRQSFLSYFNGTTTYGSGTSTIQIYDVAPSLGNPGSEVATLMYTIAGGATTVAKEVTSFIYQPLVSNVGSKFVARISNSAAASVPTLIASGYQISTTAPRQAARRGPASRR